MKVLVCDDEALARDRLVRLLRDADECEVVGEAENGREALQKVEMLAPDVVLLDIRMPVMDGIACAEELARLPNPPAVIFITAFDEHALAAFQVEAIGYLLKPVRKDQLNEALARAARAAAGPQGRVRANPRPASFSSCGPGTLGPRTASQRATPRTAPRCCSIL